MKRIGANLLALLAAVLFPLLIWVGLFVAIRPRLARVARRVSSLALVFLAGVFAPVLIWVGLFIALKERFQEWELKQSPARTIAEIMEAAGLAIQGAHITEESPADVIFTPRPLSEIHVMFARAGI
ncbi:MAG TPA: hypothetical protein VGA85_04355 [Dehalococcoidales bacterium]